MKYYQISTRLSSLNLVPPSLLHDEACFIMKEKRKKRMRSFQRQLETERSGFLFDW